MAAGQLVVASAGAPVPEVVDASHLTQVPVFRIEQWKSVLEVAQERAGDQSDCGYFFGAMVTPPRPSRAKLIVREINRVLEGEHDSFGSKHPKATISVHELRRWRNIVGEGVARQNDESNCGYMFRGRGALGSRAQGLVAAMNRAIKQAPERRSW